MENKVLTRLDIATFLDLDCKIVDAIYKYIECNHPELNDFWVESGTITRTLRLCLKYPELAQEYLNSLPKATMDKMD